MSSYSPPFQMTDEIMNLVAEISELVGIVSVDGQFTPDPKLRRENRIKSIYSSLAIEQNTLSLDQVTAVIDGKRVLGPPKDIREVQNAYEAYERLSELDPESMEDLLLAHQMMMQDLVPDAGCFRSGNVGVFRGEQLIHAGTPAAYVPEVMRQLFDWLRTTSVHPLIKGAIFHCEFEYIHPFSDGNGRTGRLWHSLILQQWRPIFAWLPIENMIHEHQEEYYQALNAAQNSAQNEVFTSFILRLIRNLLQEIHEGQAGNVVNNVVNNVVENGGKGQNAVMAVLKKKPKASAREIAALANMSERQIQRILAELKAQGVLIRHGSPKGGWWEIRE